MWIYCKTTNGSWVVNTDQIEELSYTPHTSDKVGVLKVFFKRMHNTASTTFQGEDALLVYAKLLKALGLENQI